MKKLPDLPPHLQKLIPKSIEKGIYPRFYRSKNGRFSLVWWVRVWKSARSISQSCESERYSDALALKRRLIAEIETGRRGGGDLDQVVVSKVLDDYIVECDVSDRVRHEYQLIADNRLKPSVGNARRKADYRKVKGVSPSPRRANRRKKAAEHGGDPSGEELRPYDGEQGVRSAPRGVRSRPASDAKDCAANPFHAEDFRKGNARQGFLEPAKYNALRNAFSDPAVRLLFVVAYNVGCRSGELRLLEWSMLDWMTA